MDQHACRLTLVYPPGVEDALIELMLETEPSLTGFTTWLVDGHGHDFTNASAHERVRGRVTRGVLTIITPRAALAKILEDVRTKAGVADLIYWVEPVEAFGRLTPTEAESLASAA